MSRTDRFLGCMLGLAVGDALGYPLEGLTGEQIEARHGHLTDYVEPPLDPPDRWRLPGLHSDDTQQALVIAETVIESGRADPDAICQKFLELAEGPPHLSLGAHRGAGRNFRYTVQSLSDGASWYHGSRHSAGVGASMRVAPIGLALGMDDAGVRTNAALQALTTHNDPRAVSASFLVAHLVGRLAWTPQSSLSPESLLADEITFLRRSEDWLLEAHPRQLARESRNTLHHMSRAVEGLVGQIEKPPAEVLPGIAERASELAGYTIEHPCRGFAPAGVVSALYFFLHFGGTYEVALETAINAGGDTDTVGAILGAFCGTFGGRKSIPERWTRGLRGYDLVLSRAAALAGDREAMAEAPGLAEAELEWTLEEDRLRREKTGQPVIDSSGWVRRPVVRAIPPSDRDTGDEGSTYSQSRRSRDDDGYRQRRGGPRRRSSGDGRGRSDSRS